MASAVPVAAPVTVRHYRVWATAFRVEAPDGAILDGLDRVCSQFASEVRRRGRRAGGDGGRGRGLADPPAGEGGVERRTRDGAVRHVEWRMVGLAARAEQRMIHWHAAALTRGGHTILLPGRAGAGKSTLAVALAQRGFALLGEDVVFMDPLSREIHPFQRAIRLDGASRERLRAIGFEPNAARRVGSLVPFDEVASWSTRPSPPLSHVLFVEWGGEGGPVEVAPMTHAEGALEPARAFAQPAPRARAARAGRCCGTCSRPRAATGCCAARTSRWPRPRSPRSSTRAGRSAGTRASRGTGCPPRLRPTPRRRRRSRPLQAVRDRLRSTLARAGGR